MLRPFGALFFGKILKLDATVTTRPPARLPRFRSRPGRAAAACGTVVVVAGLAVWGTAAEPQSVYGRRAALPATGRATAADDASVQAERIVLSSFAALDAAESVSVTVRQKARFGDRVLVGGGRYLQSGRGEDQRFRYETLLRCDTESFEWLEVSDGVFCWSYRHDGGDPPQLSRVDVRRVRERLLQLEPDGVADAAAYLGGLQRVLWSTRQWYRFVAAAPGELDGLPVWLVDGRWDAERLAELFPKVAEAVSAEEGVAAHQLPEGVPWGIRMAIGRADLLPRRVEWLAIPGPRPVSAASQPEPVAVLELLDVRVDVPVDAGAFLYQPAVAGLIDVTEQRVKSLGLLRR